MAPSPQRNIIAKGSNISPFSQRNIIAQGSNMTLSPQRNITSYRPCCVTGCDSGAQRWRHGPNCGRHHTKVCGGRNMCIKSAVSWAKIHTIVVWVLTPCSLAGGYQHFHTSHCHHSSVTMKAAGSSTTLVTMYQTRRGQNRADSNINSTSPFY
jgi:hypothetical protein